MKTSRASSFRLHRINKSSSVRKQSQTFYDASFAALNSVSKGVKQADLSLLTGYDLNKLRVQPLEPKDGEYNSAHLNLADVRKKYDEMKKERTLLQEKLERMKEEKGKLNIFKDQYNDKLGEAKSKAAILKDQLGKKKDLVEQMRLQKIVLQSLQDRHKWDKVVFDQRKYNAQQQLAFLRKQLSIYKKEGTEIGQSQDRTTKVYMKLTDEISRQKQQREQHISNLLLMIQQKEDLIMGNTNRQAELGQIAQRAIQDKNMNQKHWRKIFSTHAFVSKMLRNKIDKEMQKFSVVQRAFMQIKTATGVNNAQSLINKYISKEIVYGEYLSKISENQKTIDDLMNQTEKLNQESKALEMERQVLHSVKIKSQDLRDCLKELQEMDSKYSRAESFRKKIGQWVIRQLKKSALLSGQSTKQFQLPTNNQQLKKSLTDFLNQIHSQDDEAVQAEQKPQEMSLNQVMKRLRLVKTQQEMEEMDDEGIQTINEDEKDLINTQRRELVRNNQAFMQEIKRKAYQQLKQRIEQEAKKEKAPKAAAPVKKEQEDQ